MPYWDTKLTVYKPWMMFSLPRWESHVQGGWVNWISAHSYQEAYHQLELLSLDFCMTAFAPSVSCIRFIRMLVKIHIHRLYHSSTKLEPLGLKPMSLRFAPHNVAHNFTHFHLAIQLVSCGQAIEPVCYQWIDALYSADLLVIWT